MFAAANFDVLVVTATVGDCNFGEGVAVIAMIAAATEGVPFATA
jgi:uncharacterized protein (UPF0264 family)